MHYMASFPASATLTAAFAAATLGGVAQADPTTGKGGEQVLYIDQKAQNVIPEVLPVFQTNYTTSYVPYGFTTEELKAKPFHVYDDEFLDILGPNPTLALVHKTEKDPLFHEAPVWYPETDDFFFVQNAGSPDAGTGLNKSAVIQKISLAEAAAVAEANLGGGSEQVKVTTLAEEPKVLNPNGGTNWNGQILMVGQGQGADKPSQIHVMNPLDPHNTTVLLNNYFGRQFNSLNDIKVHPTNGDLYFTDSLYGFLQYFRPPPGLPRQVYRLDPRTGAVTVVADGFGYPNGIAFSPSGDRAYVTDTGAALALMGSNSSAPATIYSWDVDPQDGTWDNRKTFAFADRGIPDGVTCDTKGNVYSGVGDGVDVWNKEGKLLGKIYLGTTSANFNFAGKGRMVVLAETELYYVTLKAEGMALT